MKWLLGLSVLLVALAFVLILSDGQAAAQEIKEGKAVTGKVASFTANKTIGVELANGKVVSFNITQFTKIEGKVEVGATVTVTPGDNPRNARGIAVKNGEKK
jgi:hypothetical protein